MADANNSYGSGALKATGPSISLIDNNAGIGNFKGVMLCNRPFGGSAAVNKPTKEGGKATFTCGVVPESIGVNVPIAATQKYVKRPKKDSVLTKHKKWLSDFQKNKDNLETMYLDEMQRKEEEKARFQEKQREMRETARALLQQSKDAADTKDYKNDDILLDLKDSEAKALSNDSSTGNISDLLKAQPKSNISKKPAWALSEKDAQVAAEDKELHEADDLIDFAKELDFEKYLGDVEVQVTMERLRKRIAELEKESAMEDEREADAEARAARREMLELLGETERGLIEHEAKPSEDSVALQAAKALLQEDDEMNNVHSTKSVVSLLKSAKEKIDAVKESVRKKAPPAEAKVLNEPVIVVHEPSEGTRLEGKNRVSNLPYMHRNPAV